jgi:2-amino-4-hydroxy-6-hydroxymethyldihydropteridine diphosphokinase
MPLLELAPEIVLPGLGLAADFAASVADQGIIRL